MATVKTPAKFKRSKSAPASRPASLWRLQRSKLTELWRLTEGNPRRVLYTVLSGWTVWFAFQPTYLSLFLKAQGLSETQIGLFYSINVLVALASTVAASMLVGRVRAIRLMVATDLSAFVVGPLMLVLSHGPWMLGLGMAFCGLWGLTSAAFPLVLIEGVDADHQPKLFALEIACLLLPGFLTPLVGLGIRAWGLPAVSQAAIPLSALTIAGTCAYRWYRLKEPKQPRPKTFRQQVVLPLTVLRHENKALFLLLGLFALGSFAAGVSMTYGSLYYVHASGLALSAASLSLIPLLSSVASLVFTFWAVPHFSQSRARQLLQGAFLASFVSLVAVALAPRGGLAWVCAAAFVGGMASLTSASVVRSTVLYLASEQHKASLAPACDFLMLLSMVPSGAVGGWLFSMHPRDPFFFAAGILGLVYVGSWKMDLAGQKGPA
jgi:hypothetical protein